MNANTVIWCILGIIFIHIMTNQYMYWNLIPDSNYCQPISDLNQIYTSYTFPKNIWIYWNTPIETAPKIVQTCVYLIQKLNPQFTVNILNEKNYTRYVTDERVIHYVKSDLKPNYKSDLLRWYLIYTYGGLYVDASVLPFCSFEWIVNEMNVSGKSLLLYNNFLHTNKRLEPLYETWLIAGLPRNDISRTVYTEFLKCLDEGVDESYNRLISDESVDYQNFWMHGSYHLIYFLMINVFSKYNLHSQIKSLPCSYDSYPCMGLGGNHDYNAIFKKQTSFKEFQIFARENRFTKLASYNRIQVDKYDYPIPNTIMYYLIHQS